MELERSRYAEQMRLRRPLIFATSAFCLIVGCALDDSSEPDEYQPIPPRTTPEAGPDSATGGEDAKTDSPVLIEAGACDLSKPWGTPTPIVELNSASDEWAPRLTSDELTIVFASARPGGPGLVSIYVATRTSRLLPFGDPILIGGPVNSTGISVHPSISGDGLIIYYQSKTTPAGTSGPDRIYRATRPNTLTSFGTGTIVPELEPPNAGDYDLTPFIGGGGTRVVFASSRGHAVPDFDLYEAPVLVDGGLGAPAPISIVNANPERDDTPVLSADGRTLYFTSYRLNPVSGDFDIFEAKRGAFAGDFSAPIQINELATPSYEAPGWVSLDGCRMYLLSNRVVDGGAGALDLFITSKP